MRLSRSGLLLALLFLAGCKEDFASLQYATFVGDYNRVNGIYLRPLAEGLSSSGIDFDQVEFKLDRKDGRVIHMSMERNVSAESRAAFRTLLDDIVRDRAASSMIIDMALDAKPGAVARQPIPLTLSVSSDVVLKAHYKVGDWALGIINKTGVPAEVACAFKGKLEGDLPFAAVSVAQMPGQSSERVDITYRDLTLRKVAVPALMTIRDAQLRESVNKGDIRLWSTGATTGDLFRSKLELEIEIGKMDNNVVATDFKFDNSHSQLYGDCSDRIRKLGRPFSYHMGSSLDRLENVIYSAEQG